MLRSFLIQFVIFLPKSIDRQKYTSKYLSDPESGLGEGRGEGTHTKTILCVLYIYTHFDALPITNHEKP